jgi:DNA-directed RNA polymerase specialized sigma24 family protein
MQYEVDSYTLEYVEDEGKYYISFEDSAKQDCTIEIEKEIFDEYMLSKKAYVKIKNETSRHIEQSALTEIEIYKRAFEPKNTVEDIVIKNIDKEKLRQARKELSETQVRRIDLHIVNEVTIRDIAKLEKVQKSQIQKSLKLGLKNLKKFFEK